MTAVTLPFKLVVVVQERLGMDLLLPAVWLELVVPAYRQDLLAQPQFTTVSEVMVANELELAPESLLQPAEFKVVLQAPEFPQTRTPVVVVVVQEEIL